MLQESLKGQICRLNKELENSDKRAREMKASLTQQAAVMEADYQQTIANLRKHTEDCVRKLTDEKEQVSTAIILLFNMLKWKRKIMLNPIFANTVLNKVKDILICSHLFSFPLWKPLQEYHA